MSGVTPTPDRAIVALDVGGTAMKGAILDANGEAREFIRWSTPTAQGPPAVVATAISAIDELLERAGGASSIGIVVPGLIDAREGVAVYSENIGWRDVPFRRMIIDRTGLPVGFGHDVRAAGQAERMLGAARGERDVLFLPIGTGISGAMFVEGREITGNQTGEIGHLDIGSKYDCVCGSVGCLETVATGPSIARIYNELTSASIAGAKPVVDRMLAGDAIAARVWNLAIDALAHALASYITLLSPDLIVIGGGLSSAGDVLLQPLRSALRSRLTWQHEPRIVATALGENAACLGAGILARAAYAAEHSTGAIDH
jgi:glucokinase